MPQGVRTEASQPDVERTMRLATLAGYVLMIVGTLLLVLGVINDIRLVWRLRDSETSAGSVISLRSEFHQSDGRNRAYTSHYPTVRFFVEDKPYEFEAAQPDDDLVRGSEVAVRYLRDHPERAFVDTFRQTLFGPLAGLLFAAGMAAVGAVMVSALGGGALQRTGVLPELGRLRDPGEVPSRLRDMLRNDRERIVFAVDVPKADVQVSLMMLSGAGLFVIVGAFMGLLFAGKGRAGSIVAVGLLALVAIAIAGIAAAVVRRLTGARRARTWWIGTEHELLEATDAIARRFAWTDFDPGREIVIGALETGPSIRLPLVRRDEDEIVIGGIAEAEPLVDQIQRRIRAAARTGGPGA